MRLSGNGESGDGEDGVDIVVKDGLFSKAD